MPYFSIFLRHSSAQYTGFGMPMSQRMVSSAGTGSSWYGGRKGKKPLADLSAATARTTSAWPEATMAAATAMQVPPVAQALLMFMVGTPV